MNILKILFFTMTLFSTLLASSQDLSKHKWENRLILLITNDENNTTFQSQISEFKKDRDGLEERKLIIYQVTPETYKTGLNGGAPQKSSQLYNKYKKGSAVFEVILLGLDGGIKLRQNELLTKEKLYGIIDAMPMRRREMERNKQP
ncbi:MAG: DUF4174 domain-containing protein [Bacteroidales bacterium]